MKALNINLKIICIFIFITCKYNKNEINMKNKKIKYSTDYFITDSSCINQRWEALKSHIDDNEMFRLGKLGYFKWEYTTNIFWWLFPCTIARYHVNESDIYLEPIIGKQKSYIYNGSKNKYLMRINFN